jgi:hypothetical protein
VHASLKGADVQRKPTDQLCLLARCGGSIALYADTRPTEDLIQIARDLRPGATLALSGMAMRPIDDLCRIAEAAPGQVSFAG